MVSDLLLTLLKYWDASIAHTARTRLYTRVLGNCGQDCTIKDGVTIKAPGSLTIGDRVSVNQGCFINARGKVTIGSDVRIAHSVTIMSVNHRFSDTQQPIHKQGVDNGSVHIGDDVWIGSRSVILPGVRVASGAVVGAGSVVTKDVPTMSVVGGNPAKLLRVRE
jgi:acetyltransferase-like isoleucine patch superfamily enzyme